ncbi:MAG: calcium-binding protein, partial [Pseudomonadota bacterium]
MSTNSLGFVGYQFGEALLIDLGYYDDTIFYGAGAATNTWDGSWTGKNGVTTLDDFMTKGAQEVAIQEAFGHNLQIIENDLAQQGLTLDDFVGTTTTYVDAGQTVTVELSLTGIMAAAHLR